MLKIGSNQSVGQFYPGSTTPTVPTQAAALRWVVKWIHRSGGIKKQFVIGQDAGFYANEVDFENNLLGCGAGTVKFARVDFPIDVDDIVSIYYKGTLVYTGSVEVVPDPKGGECSLIPIWQRTQKRLYSGIFTSQTLTAILQAVVTFAAATDPLWAGVNTFNNSSGWDTSFVDANFRAYATTFSATYNSQSIYKIIDDIVTRAAMTLGYAYYWGVDPAGHFILKVQESSVTASLFNVDYPAFKAVVISTDYSGITATRYQVYAKTVGASGTSNVGQVGYGGYITFSADFVTSNQITLTINGVALSPVTFAISNANTYTLLVAAIAAAYPGATITSSATNHWIYFYQGTVTFIITAVVTGGVSQATPTTYPQLPIETIYTITEDKLTVPDVLSIGDSLAYAYANLKAQVPVQSIVVSGVNLDIYAPAIGKYISVQDQNEMVLNTVITCDTITGWTGATLDALDFVEGVGSVYFSCSAIGQFMEYAFGRALYTPQIQQVGFMAKSSAYAGTFLSVYIYQGYTETPNAAGNGTAGMGAAGVGDGTGDGSVETILINTINFATANVWSYYSFNVAVPVTRIRFIATGAPGGATNVKIDRIQFFQLNNTIYTQNIVQINYKLSPDNEDVQFNMKTYDRTANQAALSFERRIKLLETSISTN